MCQEIVTNFEEFQNLIPQLVLDVVRTYVDSEFLIGMIWIGFAFILETIDLPQCTSFAGYSLKSPSILILPSFRQYINLLLNRISSVTSGWEMPPIASALKVCRFVSLFS